MAFDSLSRKSYDHAFRGSRGSNRSNSGRCTVRRVGNYHGLHCWWLETVPGLLGVTVVLVGGLAWTCVRVAHFQPRLAVFLTTFPFGVLLLLTLGALVRGNGGASCSVSVNSRSQYASRGLPPGWPCNELAINTANQMARRDLIRRPNQLIKPTAPFRNEFSVLATSPCRGLILFR